MARLNRLGSVLEAWSPGRLGSAFGLSRLSVGSARLGDRLGGSGLAGNMARLDSIICWAHLSSQIGSWLSSDFRAAGDSAWLFYLWSVSRLGDRLSVRLGAQLVLAQSSAHLWVRSSVRAELRGWHFMPGRNCVHHYHIALSVFISNLRLR